MCWARGGKVYWGTEGKVYWGSGGGLLGGRVGGLRGYIPNDVFSKVWSSCEVRKGVSQQAPLETVGKLAPLENPGRVPSSVSLMISLASSLVIC